MKKRFDINNFLWFLILVGLFYYFYKLLATGEVVYFINPKMYIYIYFGAAVLGIIAFYQVFNIFTYRPSAGIKGGYIMFSIPLVLGLVLSPKGLNADAVGNRGIESILKGSMNSMNTSSINSIRKEYIQNDEVIITNNNYYKLIGDIYDNIEYYRNKKITVIGFVFRDDSFGKDEFVVSRMLMNCCAADAQVIGFMCRYTGANSLNINQWIKVSGYLGEGKIPGAGLENNNTIPVIIVDSVSSIEEPMDKYIYP